jgi:polyisoprenyl-phosphate glycosyltransferase
MKGASHQSNTGRWTRYMSLISIVVPTHNERLNVQPLFERLKKIFENGLPYDFELIFCDDSTDDTPEAIKRLSDSDSRVRLIRLSRRFGQAIAITAGLDYCSGDAVIIMDADLQDPPEALPQLIHLWEKGNEVVYVQRESSSNYPGYRFLSFLFYRLLNNFSSVAIPVDAGEFRLMDRKVIAFLKRLTEHSRYLRGLTVWPGFRTAHIRIERPQRLQGATNYNFRRSMAVAIDGLVGFSTAPLRLISVLGFFVVTLSLAAGIAFAIQKLAYPETHVSGWMYGVVSTVFMGGVQLLTLGIIGEYIGRIFVEVQNRPVYWVDYTIGFCPSAKGVMTGRGTDDGAGSRV